MGIVYYDPLRAHGLLEHAQSSLLSHVAKELKIFIHVFIHR
jgi:hypothetical protein